MNLTLIVFSFWLKRENHSKKRREKETLSCFSIDLANRRTVLMSIGWIFTTKSVNWRWIHRCWLFCKINPLISIGRIIYEENKSIFFREKKISSVVNRTEYLILNWLIFSKVDPKKKRFCNAKEICVDCPLIVTFVNKENFEETKKTCE